MNIDTKVYRKHESPTFGNTLLGAVPLVSEVYLMDNIELMKHYPDKYFDLAVVDPPYGINIGTEIDRSGFKEGTSKNSMTKFDKFSVVKPIEQRQNNRNELHYHIVVLEI